MKEGLTGPGDFIIEELKLVTTTGLEVDLSTVVLGITLFENIFSMTVSGTVAIMDSVNLASHGPLLGQEYLHLKIKTPTFKEENSVIDFSKNVFLVHSVSKRQEISPSGVQGFVLSFVSQELVKNQRTKVVQSLVDPWSNIVERMLVNYLDTKKNIIIEESSGVKKFVAPNIRPLDIIVLGMKQAVSVYKGEPTYLFYENLKGFNFRTLASLYNEPSLIEYTTSVAGTNLNKHGMINVLRDLGTILDYQIVSNNDSLVNFRTGMYASNLITHDILNKSYRTETYNYFDNFGNESHIVGGVTEGNMEFPLVSELSVQKDGSRVSDFPARTFVMPTSLTGSVDSQHVTPNNTSPYMAYDPHKWIQRRTSQMIQLENALNINITVHGNTLISAGDKVTVNLPYKAAVKASAGDKFDKFYKGPFIIKNIRHDFNKLKSPQKHTMHMNLVKDSLEEKLDAPTDNFEPSSDIYPVPRFYEYTT
jgi:hypothetical protein